MTTGLCNDYPRTLVVDVVLCIVSRRWCVHALVVRSTVGLLLITTGLVKYNHMMLV